MISRVFTLAWRKLAEFLLRQRSIFPIVNDCANVGAVNGGNATSRLTCIPSLFRGFAPLGAAPVLLPVRASAQRMTNPFPKNLPLLATQAGTRPKRTDHV